MANEIPAAGQVFEYHYLWKWQDRRGETEGRKKRPCCMVLVVANNEGNHVLFIAPITSQKPAADRLAVPVPVPVPVPETEAYRASLDTDIPLWLMVDELNVDVLETSYTLESRTPLGQFSPAFTDSVIRKIQMIRKAGKLAASKRT